MDIYTWFRNNIFGSTSANILIKILNISSNHTNFETVNWKVYFSFSNYDLAET